MQKLQAIERRCKACQKKEALTKENFQERRFKNKAGQPVVYYSRKCLDCIKDGLKYYYNHRDYCKEVSLPELKYKCVYEPEYTGYRGKYLGWWNVMETLRMGYLPPGSVWEFQNMKFIVRGNEGLNHDSHPEDFERQRMEPM